MAHALLAPRTAALMCPVQGARMRFRTLVLATALSLGLGHTGDAFAPQKGAEQPVVASGRAPRAHREVAWKVPASVTAQTSIARLPGWTAQWDRDTDVPLRAWGPAISAPGTVANAGAAEAFARTFLAQHIDALAPGAQASDFVLVANELDPAGRRTVAFAQQHQGLRVYGGSIGLLFAHDRLVMTSSTALPNVYVR